MATLTLICVTYNCLTGNHVISDLFWLLLSFFVPNRFEKTNEMLLNFNALSATRYENAAVDFRRHTALLLDMKRELDNVFRLELGNCLGGWLPHSDCGFCDNSYLFISNPSPPSLFSKILLDVFGP